MSSKLTPLFTQFSRVITFFIILLTVSVDSIAASKCSDIFSYQYKADRTTTSAISQVNALEQSILSMANGFPRVKKKLPPKAIDELISHFRLFADAIFNQSKSHKGPERAALEKAHRAITIHLNRFDNWYSVFRASDANYHAANSLSSSIKGHYFEALTELFLIWSGFTEIKQSFYPRISGIPNGALEKVEIQRINNLEIDFVAEKGGVDYIFETKSITPTNPRLLDTLASTRDQLLDRAEIVRLYQLSGKRKKWKVVLILQYAIHPELVSEYFHKGVVDEVIFMNEFVGSTRPE